MRRSRTRRRGSSRIVFLTLLCALLAPFLAADRAVRAFRAVLRSTLRNDAVIVDGRSYPIGSGIAGSVEAISRPADEDSPEKWITVCGWAADSYANAPAAAIVAMIGAETVALTAPTTRRAYIEETYGCGVAAGFMLRVPIEKAAELAAISVDPILKPLPDGSDLFQSRIQVARGAIVRAKSQIADDQWLC